MKDDVERRLDDFYRGLGDSARHVEARWRARAPRRTASRMPWVLAGAIAAVAVLLIALSLGQHPSESRPPRVDLAAPSPRPIPLPPESVPETPRPQGPKVEPPPPAPDPKPPPTPARPAEPPRVETPKPAPRPAPEEPKRAGPKPTIVERAVAVLREAEGAFDWGTKPLRGKQKDFAVATGDRLKASGVVKLTLADDRFLLLSPRSVVEFRPEDKRLVLALEGGDLHAELVGPGPEIRVWTKSCEVQPLGTIFTVRAEEKRTTVVVERGRVEVRGTKGKSAVRAGESVSSTEDGSVSTPFAADFRSLAWTKGHRAPESVLLFEEFNRQGDWKAEVDRGVARALPLSGGGASIELSTVRPIFEVPVRGYIQVVCRSDRASKMYVQFFVRELRLNFRKDVSITKGAAWRTLTFDFDELVSVDKSKHPGRAPSGSPVYDFGIFYGEEGEKGNLWVDAVKIVEVRP